MRGGSVDKMHMLINFSLNIKVGLRSGTDKFLILICSDYYYYTL